MKPLHNRALLLWLVLALFQDPVSSSSATSLRNLRHLQQEEAPTASFFPSTTPSVSPTVSEFPTTAQEGGSQRFAPTSSEAPTAQGDRPTASPTDSTMPTTSPTDSPTVTDSPVSSNIFDREPIMDDTPVPTFNSPTTSPVSARQPECASDCGCDEGNVCRCANVDAGRRGLVSSNANDDIDTSYHFWSEMVADRVGYGNEKGSSSSKQAKRSNVRLGGRKMKNKSSKSSGSKKKNNQSTPTPSPSAIEVESFTSCDSTPIGQCTASTVARCVSAS